MPAIWTFKKNWLPVPFSASLPLPVTLAPTLTVTLSVSLSGEAVYTRHRLFPPGREGAGAFKNSGGVISINTAAAPGEKVVSIPISIDEETEAHEGRVSCPMARLTS